MRKVLLAVLVTACAVLIVAPAGFADKGGNAANAKLCQKGKWMGLQGSDGTQFASEEACVSFGAQGGTIVPKPTCTAGSDNFSDDVLDSQPTTWAGGTIDGPYAANGPGGIKIQGGGWGGTFADGTHLLWAGRYEVANTEFRLNFTNAVSSVQLDAESNLFGSSTVTLTAYDASNSVVDSDSHDGVTVQAYSVSSLSNNIKYFTMTASQPSTSPSGAAFSNIVWGCAA